MSESLLTQARLLAQAGIAIFPVRSDKRPAIKGWRQLATTRDEQLVQWFQNDNHAGIGVPCGPDQDLICFDLDYGHTDDPETKRKLDEWTRKHVSENDMVRKTRSGGYHVICGWPQDSDGLPIIRVPRRLMPKLDVIIGGFYFVWAMADGSYTHSSGPSRLEDLQCASAEMCKVVEASAGDGGSALPSFVDAHEIMMSNGDAGMRHDALLRMTQDWAADHPDLSPALWCRGFEEWFRDIYADRIDEERLSYLLDWREDDDGSLYGELGRAFAGVATTPEMANDLLARAGEKLRAQGKLGAVPPPAHVKTRETPAEVHERIEGEFLVVEGDELLERELESIDWIVDRSIPAGNLISWAGPSGAGKTRYMSLLLACLMTGRTDLMGLPRATRPVSMLYVANEERSTDIERRVKAAMVANGLKGGKPAYIRGKEHGRLTMTVRSGENLQRDDDLLDALVEQVKRLGVELVVFDPFVTLGSGGESDPGDIDLVNSFMMELAARTGAAVGHIHHTPKDRSAAPDEQRGLDGAWRGHGSIFSALDMGDTIFPFLPTSVSSDKKKRRLLTDMERAGLVPRYVVVDSVKSREGQLLPPRIFHLTEEAVNTAGQMIGVLRHAGDLRLVEQEIEAAVNGAEMDEVSRRRITWAEILFELVGGQTKTLPLSVIHKHMLKAKAEGWSEAERLVAGRGFAEKFLTLMEQPVSVSGCAVSVSSYGREGIEVRVVKNAP